MNKRYRQYLLGGLFILIATVILVLFNKKSPSVEQIPDTLTKQQQIDLTLSETIEQGNYTFDNPYLILNPYESSPLTALMAFNTEDLVSVRVTILGKDEHSTFTQDFEAATSHLIPIYGLYPDSLNDVIVTLSDGQTKTIQIKTDPLPEDLPLPTSINANKEKLGNDLYFFTPSSEGYTAAYDVNGDVRWYLTTKNVWDIKRLKNGNLLLSSDRLMAPPYYMAGLMEMDLLGKVYTEYVFEGGYHHDAVELPNGNLLVAANNPDKMTVEDYVIELDRLTGEVVKSWDLSTVLPTEAAKSENWTEHDWFHNNSVDFDEENQAIILSGRHQDAVISIDYESGKLNWIVGDPTGWPEEMSSYFFTPIGEDFEWQWSHHSAKVLPNQNLAIFDNGNNRSKDPYTYLSANNNYSRGVIYHLNKEEMTIEQVFEFGKDEGSSFYSPYVSEIDDLGTDHYLILSGGIGSLNGEALNQPAYFYEDATLSSRMIEMLDEERIFEMELPAHYYRASKMSLYPESTSYSLELGKRLGHLGETKTLPIKVNGLFFNQNELNDTYQINFTQESDRLMMTGAFYEGDKVKLILNRLGDQRVYSVRITTTPYSAMCIDLFNPDALTDENQLMITQFINAEGLSGTYELYIEINNVVYPIHQSVSF